MVRIYTLLKIYALLLAALLVSLALFAQENRQLAVGRPQAVADLKSNEGATLVNARWFVQNGQITEKKFNLPGPQKGGGDALPLYPTGMQVTTHLLEPQVGQKDFEQDFLPVKPTDLETRQGTGLLSFAWYKVELTLPAQIAGLPVEGSTAVFDIVVDDYSEIWVNGKQSPGFGQTGNGLISGYNTRNRVILTEHAKPGEHFSIAILGINGAIGRLPENYIWVRSAVVDFYAQFPVEPGWKNQGKVYTIDQGLSQIVTAGTTIDKVAEGFSFIEGPVWHPEGYLLFSDPNTNTIYRYQPENHGVSIYMSHSGYTGADIAEYGQPGSNGLAIDREGRLIVDQHGNRRVVRIEKKGPVTVLSDQYQGKRLNSPNDLVIKSDGSVYFTDPPYGLPKFFDDRRKEQPHSGVYRIYQGETQLLSTDLGGPNGLAFSPDEKYLYVTNWDIRDIHHTKTIWRYEVQPDGKLKNGRIFFDFNFTEDEEALDGMKVDRAGNLFVSAPGGIWILDAAGSLLGKIVTPERPANLAWGDADGKTLYLTAHSSLYRLRVLTGGKFSWE